MCWSKINKYHESSCTLFWLFFGFLGYLYALACFSVLVWSYMTSSRDGGLVCILSLFFFGLIWFVSLFELLMQSAFAEKIMSLVKRWYFVTERKFFQILATSFMQLSFLNLKVMLTTAGRVMVKMRIEPKWFESWGTFTYFNTHVLPDF